MCFSAFSLSRPRWAASHPTHIPRRPKKKPLRGKKVGFAEKNCACGGGVGGCVGVGIEGRAQNIAPLHLMRCLIVGCAGMDMPSIRCCAIWGGQVFVLFHTSKAHSAIIAPAAQGSYYMAEAALFSLHATKAGNHIHF